MSVSGNVAGVIGDHTSPKPFVHHDTTTIIDARRTSNGTRRAASTLGGRPRSRASRSSTSACQFSVWASRALRTRTSASTTTCRTCLPRTSSRSSSCDPPDRSIPRSRVARPRSRSRRILSRVGTWTFALLLPSVPAASGPTVAVAPRATFQEVAIDARKSRNKTRECGFLDRMRSTPVYRKQSFHVYLSQKSFRDHEYICYLYHRNCAAARSNQTRVWSGLDLFLSTLGDDTAKCRLFLNVTTPLISINFSVP